jgi:hypothetical protein
LSVYAVISLVALTVLGFYIYIRVHVNQYAGIARKSFPAEKEKVDAMVKYMNSSNYTLKERNNMIWAIGQLSDDRALPYLQELYTGEPCKHSLNLCQYELAKAINKCGGNVEIKRGNDK